MRKFKLKNAIGQEYDLNDLDFFLYNPDQLGFKVGTKYERIGVNYHPYEESIEQPKPKGTIRFKKPGAYEKYDEFARFIRRKPLTLEYTPDSTTFKLDCEVYELKKSEIKTLGLSSDIVFAGLGKWYKEVVVQTSEDTEGDGKTYPYTYDYVYSNSARGTVTLESDTNEESPAKITIFGPVVNPTWNQYLNGKKIASGKVNATIPAGHKLVVNATKFPFSMTEQNMQGQVIHDRYGDSDWSTERFMFIQSGTNRITIGHDGANYPNLLVEVKLEYATV